MILHRPSAKPLNHKHRIEFVMLSMALLSVGCRSTGGTDHSASLFHSRRSGPSDVVGVFCIFEARPWLNLDAAGDPDPEGIQYRVFLDPGNGRGAFREGTFHIEMYRVDFGAKSEDSKRTLVSDWHYPTGDMPQMRSQFLGDGYHLHLRWGDKSIAGHDVEIITQFEDSRGNTIRSATKILRVPKYPA